MHAINLLKLESLNLLPLFSELNILGIVDTNAMIAVVVIVVATTLQSIQIYYEQSTSFHF